MKTNFIDAPLLAHYLLQTVKTKCIDAPLLAHYLLLTVKTKPHRCYFLCGSYRKF
ncbi:hypothetical protein [Microcoleus sp. S36b_A4]|uniref:hypothetical protein n=1 Tax=Microcoleus sp. S36b_A4 TaxID=3055420 RepID=UPI002FD29A97